MIPFIDLKSQQEKIRSKIDKRIKTVLDHGQYILGPEVKELEKKLGFLLIQNTFYAVLVEQMLFYCLLGLGLKPGEGCYSACIYFCFIS